MFASISHSSSNRSLIEVKKGVLNIESKHTELSDTNLKGYANIKSDSIAANNFQSTSHKVPDVGYALQLDADKITFKGKTYIQSAYMNAKDQVSFGKGVSRFDSWELKSPLLLANKENDLYVDNGKFKLSRMSREGNVYGRKIELEYSIFGKRSYEFFNSFDGKKDAPTLPESLSQFNFKDSLKIKLDATALIGTPTIRNEGDVIVEYLPNDDSYAYVTFDIASNKNIYLRLDPKTHIGDARDQEEGGVIFYGFNFKNSGMYADGSIYVNAERNGSKTRGSDRLIFDLKEGTIYAKKDITINARDIKLTNKSAIDGGSVSLNADVITLGSSVSKHTFYDNTASRETEKINGEDRLITTTKLPMVKVNGIEEVRTVSQTVGFSAKQKSDILKSKSTISANNNLELNASYILNGFGVINSNGDMTINANNYNDNAKQTQSMRREVTERTHRYRKKRCGGVIKRCWKKLYADKLPTQDTGWYATRDSNSSIPSVLEAAGNVRGNLANRVTKKSPDLTTDPYAWNSPMSSGSRYENKQGHSVHTAINAPTVGPVKVVNVSDVFSKSQFD